MRSTEDEVDLFVGNFNGGFFFYFLLNFETVLEKSKIVCDVNLIMLAVTRRKSIGSYVASIEEDGVGWRLEKITVLKKGFAK